MVNVFARFAAATVLPKRLFALGIVLSGVHFLWAQSPKPTGLPKTGDKTTITTPAKTTPAAAGPKSTTATTTGAKPAGSPASKPTDPNDLVQKGPASPAVKTAPVVTTAPKASESVVLSKAALAAVEENLMAEAIKDAEAFSPRFLDTTRTPMVIGFGSCNRTSIDQNIWPSVTANNPNLWIWLGDIIYADTYDMRDLAAQYKRFKNSPGYKQLRSKAQVVGVYDDHDFGKNDSGKSLPTKRASKQCLLNFLDVPRQQPVRKREGAYQSYTFGKGEQRVKVIVMDTRYFRDTLIPDPSKKSRYLPNTQGTLLGEDQWKWLEQELRNSTANFTLLCSSIQVVSNEHPHEKWGNFPNERKRLLNLIAQVKPKNLMILSGDRHMAEVSSMDVPGLPYPLYDFTSSGLTHVRAGDSEVNKYRVGDLILQRNFGLLKLDWNGPKPLVSLQIRGLNNQLYQEMVVKY